MQKRLLKYQNLIDELKLGIECPNKSCKPTDNIEAYRWSYSPISHEDNFLPKIVLDKKKTTPIRINSHGDEFLCSCCALSMFSSLEKARNKYISIPELNRRLLGYTHIAKGTLTNDGVMTPLNNQGHFDFFEYEDVDLTSKFALVEKLTK